MASLLVRWQIPFYADVKTKLTFTKDKVSPLPVKMSGYGSLHEIDTLPMAAVVACLEGEENRATDTDLQLRYRMMLILAEADALAAYDALVFTREDFASFYLRSEWQLQRLLEEEYAYSPYFSHLELTLLALVLENEEEERNTLILLGERITIAKLEFLIGSPIMSQERLHNIALRIPGWILDQIATTAEEYGFETPSSLVLSTEIWTNICQYCALPSLCSVALLSREAEKALSKVTVETEELHSLIESDDVAAIYFNRRFLTLENVIECCELAAVKNAKSFQIIFQEGERLYRDCTHAQRDAFHWSVLRAVRRGKDRQLFRWLYGQIADYISTNYYYITQEYNAVTALEKSYVDLFKSGRSLSVERITQRLELEKCITECWRVIFGSS